MRKRFGNALGRATYEFSSPPILVPRMGGSSVSRHRHCFALDRKDGDVRPVKGSNPRTKLSP